VEKKRIGLDKVNVHPPIDNTDEKKQVIKLEKFDKIKQKLELGEQV
jgi:hypothetical protein